MKAQASASKPVIKLARVPTKAAVGLTKVGKPLSRGRMLRDLDESDIERVLELAYQEFMPPCMQPQDGLWLLFDAVERLSLRWMIQVGFVIRIREGRKGLDHRVLCVASPPARAGGSTDGGAAPLLKALLPHIGGGDELPSQRSAEAPAAAGGDATSILTSTAGASPLGRCLAVAEVSLQPVDAKVPPAIPLPLPLKRLVGLVTPLMPYISNVLVDPECRRQGVGRALMEACEAQPATWGYPWVYLRAAAWGYAWAAAWGYPWVYLHVDVSYEPALRLYYSMGYEAVSDDPAWFAVFDMTRLRYMRKRLAPLPSPQLRA
ncbi:hypothetical protein JKP88DRAFT_347286 [Tribonema minus]|uniref:N-acetyltransferase domain-containing protein n=1 Tax=Tribonema minus TaxID=303371 RepID=A0A836CR91_9STRA|nr:hypothetical protein JKP88DRAFT_347286 [Tribonema minus]